MAPLHTSQSPLERDDWPAGRRILVTGGAGFIGTTCCRRLLEAGAEVVGLDSMSHGSSDRDEKQRHLSRIREASGGVDEGAAFEFVEADVRDTDALSRLLDDRAIDAVVHLAALAGVRGSIDRPEAYIDINERGTMSLLRAAERAGVDRMVLAGSSSVYGRSGVDGPCHESQAADAPTSPYAASKRSMEMHARAFSHLHDLSVSVVRFFTVYGPRQRPDMAIRKFMERIFKGETLPLYGDGSSCRCYTYVDDAVDGLLSALRRGGEFRVFNIGGKQTVRLDELVDALDAVADRAVEVKYLPEQPGDVPATRADLTRAQRELGYAPQINLREGLERMWHWLVETKGRAASAPARQTKEAPPSVATGVRR